MLDRFTHTERHPLAAGVLPRARREQCANAPWGDVRPVTGRSSGTGRSAKDAEKDQRGRTGMGGAVT
jgi:hypothetical protein